MLRVTGKMEYNANYGEQFKMQQYEIIEPTDAESIRRYLGSGAIKGIGESLAGRIVKRFGDDSLRIIEEEPERLAEVKGISLRKAQEIAEQVEEKRMCAVRLCSCRNMGSVIHWRSGFTRPTECGCMVFCRKIRIRWQRISMVSGFEWQMRSQRRLVSGQIPITESEAVFCIYCPKVWQKEICICRKKNLYIRSQSFCAFPGMR